MVSTNSFIITTGPEADNIDPDGTDTNIAAKDGRIYVYNNRANGSVETTLALSAADQELNSYVDLEFGYRMDAYESGGTAYIIASTADNTDYIAQGGYYDADGNYVNGDAIYDQFDTQDELTGLTGSDGQHNHIMYHQGETNKIKPDGSLDLYTDTELREGADYQLFTTDGITYHMGGVAETGVDGTVNLTYTTADLDAAPGGEIVVQDIYGTNLTYTEEMLNGTNVLNDGTGTSGMEVSAIYGTRIAVTENDGVTVQTYGAADLGADGVDTQLQTRLGDSINRTFLTGNDGTSTFTYDSAVFAAEIDFVDSYDLNDDGIDDISFNRVEVLNEATTGNLTYSGGEAVLDEQGNEVTYIDYIFDSDTSNTYDVNTGDIDMTKVANGDPIYAGQNKIGLAADPNFSGPLTGTETVRVLDIAGNLIHEFRATEAGNDEVRLVDGAVSYEFTDENVAMTVATGNVDTTQTANGALYGQTLIGT